MKSREEIMNMLEAFDLCGSLHGAGELAGVSHHTVARYVAERDAGELAGDGPRRRGRIIDRFLPKIEEWVERSHAKIRADRAFDKLKALGFTGSDRTVRRAVAEVKANHRRGRRRVYRPWIPEPGMWAQWDWGAGPVIAGRRTNLFCAWLAWSRFRVVVPCWDRTLPTVIACVDRAMRAFGGAPTYWLTDNERTVTIDHVAGIAVRHPEIVAVGGHYGITVATCVPADPESKGGSEATVRVAKADLVPTDANLRGGYTSWAELVEACDAWMVEINGREHRVTRRAPVEMLAEEQHRSVDCLAVLLSVVNLPDKSYPDEKHTPAPRTIVTRTSGSLSKPCRAPSRATRSGVEMALRLSGRFSVTRRTCSAGSSMRISCSSVIRPPRAVSQSMDVVAQLPAPGRSFCHVKRS